MMLLIPGAKQRAVERTIVAHERTALIATENGSCFQFVCTLTAGTNHLLAIARPVHGLQAGAVRTRTVVGPQTVEIGSADKESDAVAGSQHVAGIVFEIGADHVVFLRCLIVVAVHIDMTDAGLSVALGCHIDISAWILRSGKEQAGGVLLVAEDKTADKFSADGSLSLTGGKKKNRGER